MKRCCYCLLVITRCLPFCDQLAAKLGGVPLKAVPVSKLESGKRHAGFIVYAFSGVEPKNDD
jgi:hypothetical protein